MPHVRKFLPLSPAAVLFTPLATRLVDEDSPHGAGRNREEMTAIPINPMGPQKAVTPPARRLVLQMMMTRALFTVSPMLRA